MVLLVLRKIVFQRPSARYRTLGSTSAASLRLSEGIHSGLKCSRATLQIPAQLETLLDAPTKIFNLPTDNITTTLLQTIINYFNDQY